MFSSGHLQTTELTFFLELRKALLKAQHELFINLCLIFINLCFILFRAAVGKFKYKEFFNAIFMGGERFFGFSNQVFPGFPRLK